MRRERDEPVGGSERLTRLTPFDLIDGVLVPARRPEHRDDEYDQRAFDVLLRMQRDHFWYRGRHRLLLQVLGKVIEGRGRAPGPLGAIDLGGGCGGWLEFLHARGPALFERLALADSSSRALSLAGAVVGGFAERYQVDILDLPWAEEWDVVFLLDVLEHLPDDVAALEQVRKVLRPGGLVVVTAPALELFWTYNDDFAGHRRRYRRADFGVLARRVGLELVRSDYFMFLLSPALLLSRLLVRPPGLLSPAERAEFVARTHRPPPRLLNWVLETVFSLEARAVNHLTLPWGTSVLAVLERPA